MPPNWPREVRICQTTCGRGHHRRAVSIAQSPALSCLMRYYFSMLKLQDVKMGKIIYFTTWVLWWPSSQVLPRLPLAKVKGRDSISWVLKISNTWVFLFLKKEEGIGYKTVLFISSLEWVQKIKMKDEILLSHNCWLQCKPSTDQ